MHFDVGFFCCCLVWGFFFSVQWVLHNSVWLFFLRWLNTCWRERDTTSVRGKNLLLLLWIQCWAFRGGAYGKSHRRSGWSIAAFGMASSKRPSASPGIPGARFPGLQRPLLARGRSGERPAATRPRCEEIHGNHQPAWSPADKQLSETHQPRQGKPCFEGRPALSRGNQAPVGRWLLKVSA